MSKQRKPNREHPNAYYWKREETQHPATDECNANRYPLPFCALSTKAVKVTANPSREAILEAVHFLVEIGNPRHARLSGMHAIRSFGCHTPAAHPVAGPNRLARQNIG
jgi:hypothetical protein